MEFDELKRLTSDGLRRPLEASFDLVRIGFAAHVAVVPEFGTADASARVNPVSSSMAEPCPPSLDEFEKAYIKLGNAVRAIGIRRGVRPCEADSFMNRLFEKAWKKRSKFRRESSLERWIIGFAHKTSPRSKGDPPRGAAFEVSSDIPSPAKSPEDAAKWNDWKRRLLEVLTEDERSIYDVLEGVDFSVTDAAHLIGLQRRKLESQWNAIRKKLVKRDKALGREGCRAPIARAQADEDQGADGGSRDDVSRDDNDAEDCVPS